MSALLEQTTVVATRPNQVDVFTADMFGLVRPEDIARKEAADAAEALKLSKAAEDEAERQQRAQQRAERALERAALRANETPEQRLKREAKKAAAAEKREKKKLANVVAKRGAFFDFFDGGDSIAAQRLIEQQDDAQHDTQEALERNPSILSAEGMTAQEQLAAREALDDARFQRKLGLPIDEVRESLHAAGVNADDVLAQLAKVEEVVGANYPEEPIQELLIEDLDAGDDEDFADELSGEVELSEGDDEVTPKTKRAKSDESAATTALSALMRRIRGPRYEPLTEAQENALYVRIQAGDTAARNELVDHNMRFLVSRAKTFTYTGRPMDFLISAGTTGLIIAAEKFDPTRGRFTSCAAQWIRQSIQRSLLGDSLIKTPAYLPVKANKLRREADAETDPVLKAELTVKAEAADREVKARRAQHVSLDGSQDDDSDGAGLHNMFASEAEGPDEMMEKRRLLTQLLKAANELTDAKGNANDRGREIFLRRMGLHEDHIGEPQTLAEVAEALSPAGSDGKAGISRERVRQLYVTAATDVANAVIAWARGEDNLPTGFRKSLLNPGR